MVSSSRKVPRDGLGYASSHAPDSFWDTARIRAWAFGVWADLRRSNDFASRMGSSHKCWVWEIGSGALALSTVQSVWASWNAGSSPEQSGTMAEIRVEELETEARKAGRDRSR